MGCGAPTFIEARPQVKLGDGRSKPDEVKVALVELTEEPSEKGNATCVQVALKIDVLVSVWFYSFNSAIHFDKETERECVRTCKLPAVDIGSSSLTTRVNRNGLGAAVRQLRKDLQAKPASRK